MRSLFIVSAVVMLLPTGLIAQSQALSSPAEARAWYIAMMHANGCEMSALDIRETIQAAFPYEDETLRESGFMVGEAGMALHGDGLIEQTGINVVRYTGPGGC